MTDLNKFQTDTLPTAAGDLQITFLGHGSLLFTFNGLNFYVDPYSKVADYATLPKAGVILITHEHRDHLDLQAIDPIRTPDTVIVIAPVCAGQVTGDLVLANGDSTTVKGVQVEAVPAYNIANKRPDGQPFHPKGIGNGYILTFGDQRVYVAGDTENIPEMQALQGIDIAFLPMNLPYTMTPEMVAAAAKTIRPRILYPYHYGQTEPSLLSGLLKSEPGIEIRIRSLA